MAVKDIKVIAAFRNDRFGEFLLTLPAIRALKYSYPQAKLLLIVDSGVRELAGLIKEADQVLVWDNRKHSIGEVICFASKLRRQKCDISVAFNPSKEFNVISFLASVPVRAGYAHKLPFLLTRVIEDKKYLGKIHEVEYNRQLAQAAGATAGDVRMELDIDEQESAGFAGRSGVSSAVIVHPWTSDPLKQWPIERFGGLIYRLITEFRQKVVLVGSQEHYQDSRKLKRLCPENGLIDLVGKTTLKQLAYILKQAAILVSNDSGPVHLCACVGTPVVAVFRSDMPEKAPRRWGPWSENSRVIARPDLAEIIVEDVLSAVKELLPLN